MSEDFDRDGNGDDDGAIPLYDFIRYPGHGRPERVMDLASRMPGWSRLAQGAPLGQKANIAYDPISDDTQFTPAQILQLPGNDGSDLDATQIHLTLAPPLLIPKRLVDLGGVDLQTLSGEFDNASVGDGGENAWAGYSPAWPPLLYIVEWGIGGTKVKAYVDAVNGTTVNLTASFLRVYGAVSPDALNVPGESGVYTLAAVVGPGRARSGSAQRTIYAGDIDSLAASGVFSTPPLAKDVTLLGNLAGQATVAYINFYQDPAATKCLASYLVSGNQPLPFRVPNGGMYFTITSGMGQAVKYAAVFGLAI